MNESPFFKFPSTPHLIFAPTQISRTDKLLPDEDKQLLLLDDISIEEKIDGANLGISFSQSGDILLQNRGQFVLPPFLGQWEQLPRWIDVYQNRLFDILEDNFILFGEWCYAKHSIHYTSLPDWFVAFDVYDVSKKKFLSVDRRNELVNQIGVPIVPLIKYGKFSISDIPNLLGKSAFGDYPCEGLYFRLDSDGWLRVRAKYVRETFTQSIEHHWKNSVFQKNNVMY